MRRIIFLFLLLLSFFVHSEDVDSDNVIKERDEWTKRHFAAEGGPVPDGGVKVVPEEQMAQYQRFKEQRNKEKSDFKKYGYIRESLPQTQSLMNFKEVVKHQLLVGKNDPGGLKDNIRDVNMAYEFHGVPLGSVDSVLGVAPSVTYVSGHGWAGAVQYFEKLDLGICSYRENNLKYSHGAAIIPAEDVSRDVNGKVTVAVITGEKGHGFMYGIDWYDNNYFRELKCANANFDASVLERVMQLAIVIDAS